MTKALKVPEGPNRIPDGVEYALTEGRTRVRAGLRNVGGKLEVYAATDRKEGKRWVEQAGTKLQPTMTPAAVVLAQAVKMFAEKKAEVEKVLKETRKRPKRR